MDFEYRYTEEQQRLRDEATGWLDAALAALDGEPVPGSDAARALRRKLGEAGWLLPTLSKKYGGGLSPDLETALFDELYARGLAHVLDRRSNALYDTLDRWGTPEQRRRWLPDVAAGASIAVPALAANPDLDPDEVTVEAALRDGAWTLDGVQRFESAEPSPDYAWLLARNAGRGLVMLLAPLPWPGVMVRATDSEAVDCVVVIDFAGVPGSPLPTPSASPAEGWEMALSAMLAFERARSPQGSDALLAKLLDWARGAETGPGAVDDEILQEHLIDAHVAGEVERLFRARLWWAEHTGADTRYLAAQHSMQAKRAAAKLADAAREVFGPRALTEPKLAALQRRTLTDHVFRERAVMASALGLPEATAAEPAHDWAEPPAEGPITAAISRGGNDGPIA